MLASQTAPLVAGELQLQQVEKRFGEVHALRGVSLSLHSGEIVALLGENGAGKSTLGKVIGGILRPDAGTLSIDGSPLHLQRPADAHGYGIGVVHQELQVVDQLSVAENLFLGRSAPTRGGLLTRRLWRSGADSLLKVLDLQGVIDPLATCGSLSVANRQLVGMVKVLSRRARFVVLDEPTASFSNEETDRLFDKLRSMRNAGVGILYVTHRLQEVRELADRVVIMRDGIVVGEHQAQSVSVDAMVQEMVGRTLTQVFPERTTPSTATPLLAVRNLTRVGAFNDVTFTVRPGEIFGVAGLVGTGRSQLLHVIAGALRSTHGEVVVDGERVTFRRPGDALKRGIALVPEDRRAQGLLLDQRVTGNVTLTILRSVLKLGLLSSRKADQRAREIMATLGLRGGTVRTVVGSLSGGNQQKVLLGRCLATNPKILLLDEPTRGVDVGARHSIYENLARIAQRGVAIVVVSSELEELLGLCHNIGIMRKDRTYGGSVPASSGMDELMHVMASSGSSRGA